MPHAKQWIIATLFNGLLGLSVFGDKQERVSAKADAVRGGLLRVEKVEVKAATMYQHHNMRNTSDVWHGLIIIFHFLFPFIFGNRGYCNQSGL